ncbi:MAG: IS110 family transposase [Actinobacteria bacterium]|nr:IS110 family transposase [Actinomycetota bacterium]
MEFIGGQQQAEFVDKIRDANRERLLAAPIDVGKHKAAALVCDFFGEIVAPPFEFDLNERGFTQLTTVLCRAEAQRDAAWTRVGLEQAGHYHDTLLVRLQNEGLDVALLNPAQVKENRSQNLLRSIKTDARDLAAMAELIIRGKGRTAPVEDGPMARQAVLVAHRRRKVRARSALKNQILSTLDLVFPGLDGCFTDMLDTKLGNLLICEAITPERVMRLGSKRLRTFAGNRGVMVKQAKADQIVEAARIAFKLPATRADALLEVISADAKLLEALESTIETTEANLAEVLPRTAAAVLTSMPHVNVVRASNYGAAVGDHSRFTSAAQVYRLSGLVPKLYESAGRRRPGTAISREGKVELREAILDLGRALRLGHPDFKAYALQLKERGKHNGVIMCALGNRANRIAFRMMCDQTSFDGALWPRVSGRIPHGRLASTRPK